MKIKPGYHALLSMADYLADPCPSPSLSTSTAEALIKRTALHAHAEHPKLGKKRGENSKEADIGSAAHALVFGGAPIKYVETVTKRSGPDKGVPFVPTDWSTKDAQEAQAAIRDAGGIPMLPHQREQLESIANSTREALATLGSGTAAHEVSMLWEMEGVWARGRADYLDDINDVDLKTVDNADPWSFVWSPRVCIQKANRSLGHKALGHPRKCILLLVEREFPYAWSFVAMNPAKLAQYEDAVTWAAQRWRRCLDTGKFPGFRTDIHYAEPKPWEEMEFSERRLAAE